MRGGCSSDAGAGLRLHRLARPTLVVVGVLALLLSACAPRRAPSMAARGFAFASTDVYVRIVDVGPGLCAVAVVPGGHAMVYDAGHWSGRHCLQAVRELLPDRDIDLLVISHSDADHLGDGARILKEKRVRYTVLSGEPRDTKTWKRFIDGLGGEVRRGGSVLNLQSVPLTAGTTFPLGDAMVTFIAGWGAWDEPGPSPSEQRNVVSVVARLEYRGRSVLFTGDTIGRRLTAPDDACTDAEKVMVERHEAGAVPLTSDVLVAAHHGGNNGSAACFIEAVDPQFVIFSAGHAHGHPTARAVARFLAHGVLPARIFRTDVGDDEPDADEWKRDSVSGCTDPAGDDDVEITLRLDGVVDVGYLRPPAGCDSRGVR